MRPASVTAACSARAPRPTWSSTSSRASTCSRAGSAKSSTTSRAANGGGCSGPTGTRPSWSTVRSPSKTASAPAPRPASSCATAAARPARLPRPPASPVGRIATVLRRLTGQNDVTFPAGGDLKEASDLGRSVPMKMRRLPLVEWDGVACLRCRRDGSARWCAARSRSTVTPWKSGRAPHLVSPHRLPPGATEAVGGSDPSHGGRDHRLGPGPTEVACRVSGSQADRHFVASRLDLGQGDHDVEGLDLQARYGGCGCTGRGLDHDRDHQRLRVPQGGSGLPAARAGPPSASPAWPNRPKPNNGATSIPGPSHRRTGRGHHRPAPGRPAALRPLPLPAHYRPVGLQLQPLHRPQTGHRPGEPAIHRRRPLHRLLRPAGLQQNPGRGPGHPGRRSRLPSCTTADNMVVTLGRARAEGTWAAKLRTYAASHSA